MSRYLLIGVVAAGMTLASPAAPAQAAPNCPSGPDANTSCVSGGCFDVTADGVTTPCDSALPDLFPQGPPVEVELGIGGGIG